MLVDADVVFFQPPHHFFLNQQYTKNGAWFFNDRVMLEHDVKATAAFYKKVLSLDHLDKKLSKMHLFRHESFHTMESGIVLVDTITHFAPLLVTCTLNVDPIRSLIEGYMYGDKETYWLGFELTRSADYQFNSFPAGVFYDPSTSTDYCSAQIVHVDDAGKLLWSNGGFLLNKYNLKVHDERYLKPNAFLLYHPRKYRWVFRDSYLACLEPLGSSNVDLHLDLVEMDQQMLDVWRASLDQSLTLTRSISL